MARRELTRVAEALRSAADEADAPESRDRLRDQAEQFETMAGAARGPDHGRLARHEHILKEIKDTDPDAGTYIENALDAIHAYRETLEGV